jgi:hypothetical protein
VQHRGQPAGPADEGHIAVAIGAEHRHAEPPQRAEQQRRRMPVVVVQADADHRDAGVHCGEEAEV